MQLPWWKKRVFYQIYPRSFQDSDGDGIGDLRGIISRLDYLQWLGIGAVWLSPVYDSPNADMGYDIRNYEAIMQEFGTMDDFEELLAGLHQRDIKLIMDLVVNHSSDEHAWFMEARKSRDNPYRDYYIWRDGKAGREPNNWASFFTPSAWSYDGQTGQWYLHLFSEKQPDLNWENPDMREDIYGMINRWFDKGVDGFRMDVISLLAKDQAFPDGEGEGYVFAPEYFAFQPKLHDYLREMRAECFDGRDCMCVGETAFVNTQNAPSVVGDGRELDLLFQFDLMDIDSDGEKWNVRPFELKRFKEIVASWQKAIGWNTLFLENHDQPRIISRFLPAETEELRIRSAKMLALAIYLAKGTPFIYQGEEIGMTNFPFSEESELRDVESLNLLAQARSRGKEDWAWQGIRKKGRDNARTPMQWDATPNAGFTAGVPWLQVNPNYTEVNVRKETDDPHSVLHFYRNLIFLRQSHPALLLGSFEMLLPEHEQLYAFRRSHGEEHIEIFCNFSAIKMPLQVPRGEILLEEAMSGNTLEPYGFCVIQTNT